MTKEHRITPPPELVQEWGHDANLSGVPYKDEAGHWAYEQHIATRAAQWGSDQELEACCADIRTVYGRTISDWLRSLRRPKPPSLKDQALKELAWIGKHLDMPLHNYCNAIHIIHQALKKLDD